MQDYFRITVVIYFRITVVINFRITVVIYFRITVVIYFRITVVIYFRITVVIYFRITVVIYFRITVVIYFRITVVIYFRITVVIYFRITVVISPSYIITTITLQMQKMTFCQPIPIPMWKHHQQHICVTDDHGLCLLDFKTTRLGCTYIRKENRTPTIKIASSTLFVPLLFNKVQFVDFLTSYSCLIRKWILLNVQLIIHIGLYVLLL